MSSHLTWPGTLKGGRAAKPRALGTLPLLLGLLGALGCQQSKAPLDVRAPLPVSAAAAEPSLLYERFECNRCHRGRVLAAATPNKDCTGCHQQILNGNYSASVSALARWQDNIHSLVHVPSLDGVHGRLRRDWVRKHLLNPRDSRPGLAATMPRLDISTSTARVLARQLVPEEAEPRSFDPRDIPRGRALFERLRCHRCHVFTGLASPPPTPTLAPRALAPDLRLTRERFQSGRLVEWLSNPAAMLPDTAMPNFNLSARDAESLAAFIMLAPTSVPTASSVPARLPILDRLVGWDEVETRVMKKVCWHCHADPDYAYGDGGPGFSGGFGFPERGLDLSSYHGIGRGILEPTDASEPVAERMSVFGPWTEGASEPLLVRALWNRHREVAGLPTEGPRGMPLGLPPLPAEDIQLVETWIAQGRPRATE